MGRGRAKAKQTKVARDLKYQSIETDFGALAQELHGSTSHQSSHQSGDSDDAAADDDDTWVDYSPSRD